MVKNVVLAKEIVITAENKAGLLASAAKVLADHDINIEAVAGYAAGNEAKLMLITDDNLRATDALKKAGFKTLKEVEVVLVELENKPGALKTITAKMAEAGIDIKYTYGTICSSTCPAKLVLNTSNNEKVFVSLKGKK